MQVGASGRVPILEVDHVEDAAGLRAGGLDAAFLFIGLEDMGQLLNIIHAVRRESGWGGGRPLWRDCVAVDLPV